MRNKKLKSDGFTIIEVLIVLAIAGLIMLIVFLAVPALNRNSHNTQRRNDVSSILAAMGEYVNNNGGSLPSSSCSGNCDTTAGNWLTNAKLGIYTTSGVNYTTSLPGAAPDVKTVTVVSGYKCGSTPTANPTNSGATNRNFVAWFSVESSGGGSTPQCQEGS
jgi:prepilin-type N-terminal cleavage/methylation domain-containing protein